MSLLFPTDEYFYVILQILLDVVSVFNTVSTLSQKAQSVKISQEGFEVGLATHT